MIYFINLLHVSLSDIVYRQFFLQQQFTTSVSTWNGLFTLKTCGQATQNKFVGKIPLQSPLTSFNKTITLKPFFKVRLKFQMLKIDTLDSGDRLTVMLNDLIACNKQFQLCKGVASICGNQVKDTYISSTQNFVQNQYLSNEQTNWVVTSSEQLKINFIITTNHPAEQNLFLRKIMVQTERCHWTCKLCTGPLINNCIGCHSSANLDSTTNRCLCPISTKFTFQGTCTSICPSGTKTENVDGLSTCVQCPTKYRECQPLHICTSGFRYDAAIDDCVSCSSHCTSCLISSQCTVCQVGYITNMLTTCVPCQIYGNIICPHCSQGFFENQENICSACPYSCKQCTSLLICQSSNFQCVSSCPALLNKVNSTRECSQECPIGSAAYKGICMSCDQKCQSCFFPANPQKCISCREGMYFYRFTCNQNCPSGYSAQGITNRCVIIAFNPRNNTCKTGCDLGFFYSKFQEICVACPFYCLQCSDQSTCAFCIQNYGLTPQKLCFKCGFCLECNMQFGGCSSCLAGFSLYRNSCNKCQTNCLRCQFYDTCLIQKTTLCNQITGQCRSCSSGCAQCYSQDLKCIVCIQGFELYGQNQCRKALSNCIPNYDSVSCQQNCISKWDILKFQCVCDNTCESCSRLGLCLSCRYYKYIISKQADKCEKIKDDSIASQLIKIGKNISKSVETSMTAVILIGGASIIYNLFVDSISLKLHFLVNMNHGKWCEIAFNFLFYPQPSFLLSGIQTLYISSVQRIDNSTYRILKNNQIQQFFDNQFNLFNNIYDVLQEIFIFCFRIIIHLLLYYVISLVYRPWKSLKKKLDKTLQIFIIVLFEIQAPFCANLWAQLLKRPYKRTPQFITSNFIALFLMAGLIVLNCSVANYLINLQIQYDDINSKKVDSYTRQLYLNFSFKHSNPFLLLLQYFQLMVIPTILMTIANPATQLPLLIFYNVLMLIAYLLRKKYLERPFLTLSKALFNILFQIFLLIYLKKPLYWVDMLSTSMIVLIMALSLLELLLQIKELILYITRKSRQCFRKDKKSKQSVNRIHSQYCMIVEKKRGEYWQN